METKLSLSLPQVGMRSLTPSSLLIPDKYLDFFLMRKAQFGSINAYFLYLLAKFARNLPDFGIEPRHTTQKWKTQYQAYGQRLRKKSFIPDPPAWEAFRVCASNFGISMCYLFVIAMRLDHAEWEDLGCPEGAPEQVMETEDRKTLPCFVNGGPEKYKNFIDSLFSTRSIDFSTEILTRAGRQRQ